ncbi:MAG: hypothetical protein H7177_00695 [Rhizobacter sp.]|nr:hypothetical protein [Bacteriovorax sp.]
MKKIILALTVLLPLSLYAVEPVKLDGQYMFKEVKTDLVRNTEIVPVANSNRFKELVADHYDCYLKKGFYNCQKFLHNVEMPEDLKNDMNMIWSGRFFDFIATSNSPSVTNESEDLMEWDIFDRIRFEGNSASSYHYYLIRGEPEVHKITINFADMPRYMVIENESRVSMAVQRTLKISNLKSQIFDLEVFFNRSSK